MSKSKDPATERQRPLTAWNDTRWIKSRSECIHSLFAHKLSERPRPGRVVTKSATDLPALNERGFNSRAACNSWASAGCSRGHLPVRSLENDRWLVCHPQSRGAYVPMDRVPAEPWRLCSRCASAGLADAIGLLDLLPPSSAKVIAWMHWSQPSRSPASVPPRPRHPENWRMSSTLRFDGNPKA